MSSVASACVSGPCVASNQHLAYPYLSYADGIELMLIIIATFGQALSGQGHAVGIIGVLVVWRFIMGIGIGGDYPLSAVISSEFASTHIRGRMMTAVFANQGWGQFCTLKRVISSRMSGILNTIPSCCSNRVHHCLCVQDRTSER